MKGVYEFLNKKQARQKIAMVTCYDYTSARIINNSNIDSVLVGDSAAMVMGGAENTTNATLTPMRIYTEAVARGAKNQFIVADLPFMSYRKSRESTLTAVETLVQAGAQAVKLEGAVGNLEIIQTIVESGVPVMGHIGLMPQHVHTTGQFKVQAKTATAAEQLLKQAKQLEQAGCFAIVLECIPTDLAEQVTLALKIPTIGIGAGAKTDGQILVFQDLLGLQTVMQAKFMKAYLNGAELFERSINQYVAEVQGLQFPTEEYAY